jgi:hypothetical protein
MPSNRITTLPHKLKVLTDNTLPTIRSIYASAVNAQFPAHQVNGIWHYDEDDLPAIMAAFGLRPRASTPTRAPRAAVEQAV